jgi:hypothetical protein
MKPWRKRFKHGHKRNCNKKWRSYRLERILRPDDITRHHRKPKRHGGSNYESNISNVRRDKHQAWNVLFDSLKVPYVFDNFIRYWRSFGRSLTNSNCLFGKIKRKKVAWMILFDGLKPHEILSEINNVWIDPGFYIFAEFPDLNNAKLIRIRDGKVIRDVTVRTVSNYQQQPQIRSVA